MAPSVANPPLPAAGASPARHGAFGATSTIVAAFAAIVVFLASSSAPTPLYGLYQRAFQLTPLTITVIFACYSFGLLASLFTVGALSDHVGRRPVIVAALVLNALAMIVFLRANFAGALMAARFIQGFSAGMAMTAIGAAIVDLDPQRGPALNGIAPFGGLTSGALGSAILVSYAPAPLHLVYILLLAASLLLLALLWRMPETKAAQPFLLREILPRISVPSAARVPLFLLTPLNIASWTLGAFYFSLMPSLVRVATGYTSPLVGGTVVAALTVTAGLSVLVFRQWPAARLLRFSMVMLVVGVSVTLAGIIAQAVWVLIVGTLLAGFGFGGSFAGNLRTLLPLAGTHERAGLLSAYYLESYLAFSLPAIGAGLLVPVLGLPTTAIMAFTVVLVLALLSLGLSRLRR
jgi:hypothetical protein